MKVTVKLRLPSLNRPSFPYRAAPVPHSVEPLPPERTTGVDYDTDWARRFSVRMARALLLDGVVTPAVFALASPDRRGLDRLEDLKQLLRPQPGRGRQSVEPVIFAANHHSHIDTPLLLASLPEPWRHKVFVAAAADYFFRNRVTSAASALVLNAIPIERTRVSRRSADDAAALIIEGWSLLIFPEGGRSPDGWGQPFRGGAAYLAARCHVPVVPVHLEGTGRILRKGKRRPSRSATRVTFGTPIRPDDDEDARRFALRIERAVAALADEATTDWYSARLRVARAETTALTGPDAPSWRRTWALGDRGPKHRTTLKWPDLD